MGLGANYPVVSTGSIFTAIDTFNSALENNGALNVPGQEYQLPVNAADVTTTGAGIQKFVKYVRYNPTVSQTILTGPAPVYWKDFNKTVVTGLQSEACYAGANAIAGWLLYNTGTLASALAATINGNFCFIFTGGYLKQALVAASTAVGDAMIGGASAFTPVRVAAGTAPTNKVIGFAETAIATLLADVYVPYLN